MDKEIIEEFRLIKIYIRDLQTGMQHLQKQINNNEKKETKKDKEKI